ncbi:MAG: outer membrane protein [Flavobacteriales bacterium]|jgi:outer membrane protein
MKLNLSIILVLTMLSSVAQETFTLTKAHTYALDNNKNITNAKLDQKSMESKIWEIKSSGLPQVNGSLEFQNFIDIPTQVLPANAFNPAAPADELVGLQFGTNYNATGGINVSQLLFSGNYIVGVQAIKASSQIYAQLTEKQEIDVKADVSEAFYTVLILKENKAILDSTLENMAKLYELTQKLVTEEVMIRTDAAQLELGVVQIENAISTLESQIILSKNLLKFQMGYPLASEIKLEGTLDPDLIQIGSVINPENNIDYKMLTTQLELNQLSLKNTKANYLPTVSAFFSYQQQALRNEFNFFASGESWYPTTLWGVKISVPIFSSGQRNSQVEQAAIEVDKTEFSMEMLSEGLQLQILQAQTSYDVAIRKMEMHTRAQQIAAEVLKDKETLFKEGVATSIEITQAQSQLLTESTNYTNALFEMIKSKLTLEKLSK